MKTAFKALIVGLWAQNALALDVAGYGSVDLRFFTEAPAYTEQNSSFAAPSVMAQPEFRHEWNGGNDRFTAIPFGRYDSLDSNRSHWDVREFNWLHKDDGWNLRAGVGKVFWGVTESRHLVDIINQSDFVENIDGKTKLGQPMLNWNASSDYGEFNLFYLPYFRERTFQAPNGRLRFTLPVAEEAVNLIGQSHWHPDFAGRWSRSFDGWDVGLAHFYGISREARFSVFYPQGAFGPPTWLIPEYDVINQTSLDVQGAVDNWLFKLEAMTRSGQGRRFAASVAGFEYTLYQVMNSTTDVGLLLEYQYDGRDLSAAPPVAFTNGIYAGTRIALNDEQDTKLLLGVTVDAAQQTTMLNLEASRRLGDNWKVELETRLFKNITASNILYGMRKDDYVQLRLIRFF
jgi:hypothetical protein